MQSGSERHPSSNKYYVEALPSFSPNRRWLITILVAITLLVVGVLLGALIPTYMKGKGKNESSIEKEIEEQHGKDFKVNLTTRSEVTLHSKARPTVSPDFYSSPSQSKPEISATSSPRSSSSPADISLRLTSSLVISHLSFSVTTSSFVSSKTIPSTSATLRQDHPSSLSSTGSFDTVAFRNRVSPIMSSMSEVRSTSRVADLTVIANLKPNAESKWSRWSSWSDCTKTCGSGTRYRNRTCVAINQDAVFAPISCAGKSSQTGSCAVWSCPAAHSPLVIRPTLTATLADFQPEKTSAPPNKESTRSSVLQASSIAPLTAIADLVANTESKWSRWSSWSDCSKTCGAGLRYRKRKCVAINDRAVFAPITCAGKPDQFKPCAEWSCPDCSRNCTTGTLNAACDACTCDHHVLTGRVLTVDDTPLTEAKISLTGTPYNILAKTNISGHFTALGVCAHDQELLVTKDGFVPVTQKAVVLTPEKATIIAKMEIAVPPFVTIHPESKIRLLGQNVTFCCNGQGNPSPEIEWFKESNIIDKELYSLDSTLKITAEHGFNGSYRCRVVNDFGSEFSDGAVLKIIDTHEAFCDPIPRTKHLKLPPDCVQQGTTRNVVDIGDCPSVPCLQNDSDSSNACKDKTFCCGVSMVEELNITCGSVAEFKLSKAKYCGCGVCKKAVITIRGVVVGGKEERPVKFAQIEYDGEKKANADFRSGSFSFEIRDGRKRLAVTFKDTYSREFEDLTKVFHLQEGQSVITKVVLATKQRPVVFDTSQDLSVPLGGETDDSAFADLEIPGGSLLKEDGTSYIGQAKMRLNLVDPRNASDILSAPGDFSAVDEDGEEQILSSFGMMRVNFEDTSGNQLTPSKPMKVFLDPQQLNISVDDNGNTTVKLWWLNEKTGRWVLAGNIWSDEKGSARRKRSSSRRFLVTEITQAISKSNLNFDVPSEFCFVGVSAPPGSTTRVMCGFSSNDNLLEGYREETSNSDGIACVPTWRERVCYLQAESDSSRFLTPDGGNIASFPYGTNARVVSSDPGIAQKVESFKFYTSVRGSGPVYPFSDLNARCYKRSADNKYFRFQTPEGADATFSLSSPRIDDSNHPLNWYPPSPSDIDKQDVCFIKVLAHNTKATFLASSFRGNRQGATDAKVGDYATITVDSNRSNEFVACLQIRCPGIVERAEERTDVHIIPIAGHCHFQSVKIPQEFMENNLDKPCDLPPSDAGNHEKWICVPNGLTSGFDIDFVYRADKSQENLAKHRCLVGRKNKNQITDTPPSTSGSSLNYRCE